MEPVQEKSFVNVAVISGSILGIITSLLFYGLMLISLNSGSTGVGGFIFGCVLCCGLTILPGLLANRLYIFDIKAPIEVGKGALIGLVAGVCFGIVLGFMNVVWGLFGVDPNQLFIDYYISLLESFDLPETDDVIAQMQDAQEQGGSGIGSLIINTIAVGVLNVLSGLAGASLFSRSFENNTI